MMPLCITVMMTPVSASLPSHPECITLMNRGGIRRHYITLFKYLGKCPYSMHMCNKFSTGHGSVHVCVCVCVCNVCACMCTYVHVNICACVCRCVHACVRVCVYA